MYLHCIFGWRHRLDLCIWLGLYVVLDRKTLYCIKTKIHALCENWLLHPRICSELYNSRDSTPCHLYRPIYIKPSRSEWVLAQAHIPCIGTTTCIILASISFLSWNTTGIYWVWWSFPSGPFVPIWNQLRTFRVILTSVGDLSFRRPMKLSSMS